MLRNVTPALAVLVLPAVLGYAACAQASGRSPESQALSPAPIAGAESAARAALVSRLVTKWGNFVAETYQLDASVWVNDMAGTFAQVPMSTLELALRARTFDEMNAILVPSASAMSGPAGAAVLQPKALGDIATDLVFVPITPCRIADTRLAGGQIATGATRSFDVTAVSTYSLQGGAVTDCDGAGAAGSFAAAALNITVVTPPAAGYITAFPFGATMPLAATVNYVAGDIRGNFAIVKLDQGASANELSIFAATATHVVIDMVGYFVNPQATNFNCVATSVQTLSISANSTNFFNNPACPAGYTATTPYCWTAASGVYSQGSGYNANQVSNTTFCAWQNTTGASQQVFGGNICCRVPGR